MRFIYADPGLKDEVGHHANACRIITGELRARGIEPEVLAFNEVTAALQQSVGAKPFFRAFTYWTTDGDPICGWLSNFQRCAEMTGSDLARLTPLRGGDVVYVNSAQPSQFMAMAQWMRRLPDENLPHVVLEFGTDPGVQVRDGPEGLDMVIPDTRSDARPVLHRYASLCIQKRTSPRLHLVTFDAFSSQVYSFLLNRPVGILPLLQHAARRPRLRVGNPGVTVAVLGHQRRGKGYELMPQVAKLLFAADPMVRLLVHNGEPKRLPEVHGEIQRLAAEEPRLRVDERAVDGEGWSQLLDSANLILCPYLPVAFRAAYSAVAAEAIANAIPLVGPANTTLASLIQEFGVGETFESFEPQSIADGVMRVIRNFDGQARRALAAAEKWPQRHGPGRTVDAILGMGRA